MRRGTRRVFRRGPHRGGRRFDNARRGERVCPGFAAGAGVVRAQEIRRVARRDRGSPQRHVSRRRAYRQKCSRESREARQALHQSRLSGPRIDPAPYLFMGDHAACVRVLDSALDHPNECELVKNLVVRAVVGLIFHERQNAGLRRFWSRIRHRHQYRRLQDSTCSQSLSTGSRPRALSFG